RCQCTMPACDQTHCRIGADADSTAIRQLWTSSAPSKCFMRKLALVTLLTAVLHLAGCAGLTTSTTPPPPPGDITKVNHVIYMLQENRSFDQYFGSINAYRQSKGLGADADVTPSTASQLSYDHSVTFTPFHMNSMCTEDLSAYWNEGHNAWNHSDHTS